MSGASLKTVLILASVVALYAIGVDAYQPGDRHTVKNQETKNLWVEQVGKRPQVFYFHNFLTDLERQHVIRLAAPMMKRSTVVDGKGGNEVDNIRTSYGMFIKRQHDPIIAGIERRISLFTHYPVVHQEEIQVLRYTEGQKYGAHYDSVYDKKIEGPHQRIATFYMYLSDVEEGGETAFPKESEWFNPATQGDAPGVSDCAKGHVHAKPKAGDAALFYSFFPNGTMDPASMHTGCPVLKGIKWGAPVWIHIDEFNPEEFGEEPSRIELLEPGMCEDYHESCPTWAARGECSKSEGYMTGIGRNHVGYCRRACGACEPCSTGDISCIMENRKKGGYLEIDREEMEWLGVPWWYDEHSPEL